VGTGEPVDVGGPPNYGGSDGGNQPPSPQPDSPTTSGTISQILKDFNFKNNFKYVIKCLKNI
jgi:hypothetical protein